MDQREVAEVVDWLAVHAHENLGPEIMLRRADAAAGGLVSLSRRDGALSGVSVWIPGGQWFLEADGPDAVDVLVAAVVHPDGAAVVHPDGAAVFHPDGTGAPAKVTVSGTVKPWLRPRLLERGVVIRREHDLLALACRKPPDGGNGRWATAADRPALERYQAAYNQERGTAIAPDWDTLLSRPAVAVVEDGGSIVAVVKRTADTAGYATIGGTWTDPGRRQRGLAGGLTAFVVARLLAERPAVHLVVDDDNQAAIALYRSLGFEEAGRCWMGYLAP